MKPCSVLAWSLLFTTAIAYGAAPAASRTVTIFVPSDGDAISSVVAELLKLAAANEHYLVEVNVLKDPHLTRRNVIARLNSAPADGSTLMIVSRRWKERISLSDTMLPVSRLAAMPFFFLGQPEAKAHTFHQVLQHAKAAGRMTVGFAPNDPLGPLALEFLTRRASLGFKSVLPRSAQSPLSALMTRTVDVAVEESHTALPYVRTGQVIPLVTTGKQRLTVTPLVAAASEMVADYELVNWVGVFASALTPPEAVQVLNREINRLMSALAVRVRLTQMGLISTPVSSSEFAKQVGTDSSIVSPGRPRSPDPWLH